MNALKNIVLLTSLTVSSLAFAEDTQGTTGVVTALDVNTTSADTYLQFHGRVVIASGKTLNNPTEYMWGGTSCGTRVLPDTMLAMLQRALESGAPVLPRYQIGQGSAKCLVGFKIAP